MEFKPGVSMRVQVADDLRRRIQAGEWKAGDRLPGVVKLCEEYGCCMEVVRRAEWILAGEGWLNRPRQGIWTRVAGRPPEATPRDLLAEAREAYSSLGAKLEMLASTLDDAATG